MFTANPGASNASIVQSNFAVRDVDAGFAVSGAAICARTRQGWLAGPDDKVALAVDLGDAAARKLRSGGPGDGPKSVVAMAESRAVFVANPDANAVTVYDAESLAMQAVVPVPDFPTRGVSAADGAFACFVCNKANLVVAVEVGSVVP